MAVSFEGSAVSPASAEAVFAAWRNVAGWATGDGPIRTASIDGPFAIGAVIKVKAKRFPPSTFVITKIDGPGSWSDESRLPGLRMVFDHLATPGAGGTAITERVTMTGPLAGLAGRVMRKRMIKLFVASSKATAARAEAQA